MRKAIIRAALVLATLAVAPVAAQQRPPAAAGGDVVVVGRKDRPETVRQFAEALRAATGERQLSRFETRDVCPAAFGLPPAMRATVVARMRQVASAAGVPVDKANCRPNVLVLVTGDKRALMEALIAKYAALLGGMPVREARALAERPGPVLAWHKAGGPLNADGVELPRDPDTGMTVNNTTAGGSRITFGGRPHLAAAVVVVEAKALEGLTTTQLADYAAMRAFAQVDADALTGAAVPTILTIFATPMGGETPITLSSWDLQLLRGLYRSPANVQAASQRSSVARHLQRSVQDPAPPARPTP